MLYVLALFLPPVACLLAGKPGHAILNIFLCLMGGIPGIIHAFVIVAGAAADKRTNQIVGAMQQGQQMQQAQMAQMQQSQLAQMQMQQAQQQKHPPR